jgi:hypothetical protein
MFSMDHGKPHSAVKKMVSNVYSKSYISSSPAVESQSAAILYDRLLAILNGHAESKEPTEVLALYFATSMDFMTAFLFGLRSSTNLLEDQNARKWFLKTYESAKSTVFWVSLLRLHLTKFH